MKNIRGFALGLALGLAAALSTVGIAQTNKQTDQPRMTESCCAMEACCCKGDSCSQREHAKKAHAKDHSSTDGCCCCNSDSCDLKMKDMKDKTKGN